VRLIPEIIAVEKLNSDLSSAVAIVSAVNDSCLHAASFVSTAKNHLSSGFDWMAAN
jgi:hypothetical protein